MWWWQQLGEIVKALVALRGTVLDCSANVAIHQLEQIKLLRAIRFRSGTAAFVELVVVEQRDMSQFLFGVGVQAQDDDAVRAAVQVKLPSGEVFRAESPLDEHGKATVTSNDFVGQKGDVIPIMATLFDDDGNPSATVEDYGIIRDTIGPKAPLLSVVTLEQLPDPEPAPTEELPPPTPE